jgi:hypothetical protein
MVPQRRGSRRRRRQSHVTQQCSRVVCLLILGKTASQPAEETVAASLPLSQPHLRGRHDNGNTLELVPNATVRLPLHAVAGTHHVTAWMGEPPQAQTLIVDTGSRLTATACEPCSQCGTTHAHPFPHLDPQRSSTLRYTQCGSCLLSGFQECAAEQKCGINQRYTEGSSWTAVEVSDTFVLGGPEISSLEQYVSFTIIFAFGCQQKVRGLFRTQYANGILGLERSDLSLIKRLWKENVIPRESFSLCMTPFEGYIGLGGPLRDKHTESMKYTPFTSTQSWYAVHVVRVFVGDECLTSNDQHDTVVEHSLVEAFAEGKGTILDSGTTDTYLPKAVAGRMREIWARLSNTPFQPSSTYAYTYDEFRSLPIVTFELATNVTLQALPKNFMEDLPEPLRPWTGRRKLMNRLYADEVQGAVVGLNTMVGYDLLFDVQGNRFGVAPALCGIANSTPAATH